WGLFLGSGGALEGRGPSAPGGAPPRGSRHSHRQRKQRHDTQSPPCHLPIPCLFLPRSGAPWIESRQGYSSARPVFSIAGYRRRSTNMSEQVPYANYQYEIYLRGLGGQRPARPLDWRRLERDAYRLLAEGPRGYIAGGAGLGEAVR